MKNASVWRTSIAFAAGVAAALLAVTFGPTPADVLPEVVRPASPHERYARGLAAGELAGTALASEWLQAAERALASPVSVKLPFAEAALVDAARPAALGYAVALERGQRLDVEVTVKTDTPGRIFVDLFEPPDEAGTEPRAAASARDGETALSHEAESTGVYVLRVQPELLRGGHVRVTAAPQASLIFPVKGGGARDIRSIWGDPRDAGRRRHQGVDIFAARGTPVVAASDGYVVHVGENRLGGQVIWLRDPERGLTYYYAHLQEQLIADGARVRAGDVLGTVGNTGNARTTPPHLHFGIYAFGEGAIDPHAFVRPVDELPAHPTLAVADLGTAARTRRRVPLRTGPSTDAPVADTLPPAASLRVEGSLGGWVRTRVPGHLTAFVPAREIALEKGEAQQ